MRRILIIMLVLVSLGTVAWAQDQADYQNWMKSNGAAAATLGKALTAKAGDAAAIGRQDTPMKVSQANCGGCHMAHWERAADGSFKMKDWINC
jgi:mono/diheme cytochrome c family protein